MDSHGARDGEIEKGIATVQAITWEVGHGEDGSCGGGVCHECIASHEDVAQIRCHQRRRES
ncbi:hypothetical protein YC2023_048825 [Brassica napus]